MATKKKISVNRILAMDLSLSYPAFAVMDVVNGKALVKEIFHCDNKTDPQIQKLSHPQRLNRIADVMREIHKAYPQIDYVVREKGFSRYAATTQTLFKVVGVNDLMIYELWGHTRIDEIAPTSVKSLIAGYGRATKQEVEVGVREHLVDLQKDIEFSTDDESDAVAVGISWLIKGGYLK